MPLTHTVHAASTLRRKGAETHRLCIFASLFLEFLSSFFPENRYTARKNKETTPMTKICAKFCILLTF